MNEVTIGEQWRIGLPERESNCKVCHDTKVITTGSELDRCNQCPTESDSAMEEKVTITKGRHQYLQAHHEICSTGIGLAKLSLILGRPQQAMEDLQAASAKVDEAVEKFLPEYHAALQQLRPDRADKEETVVCAATPNNDAALHFVLSYIAYGAADETGLHPGLVASVKEKLDGLRK